MIYYQIRLFYLVMWILLITFISPCILISQDVTATQGMVASAHPLASQAGVEILRQGGNAVDAAVAAAFALGVVEPNASGLGGGGFLLIRMQGENPVTINYREMAPQAAKADRYYRTTGSFDSLTQSGVYAIGVPGVAAGLAMALDKYGTLPLSRVLVPAIQYARQGFEISENLATMIFQNYDLIQKYPATAAIFLEDDLPPPAGSTLTNPNLATSMELLAKNGPQIFYQGELGKNIIETVTALGGALSKKDLGEYQAIFTRPVQGSYRGYTIYSSAPPAGGGTHLIELLNILECYELSQYPHNSAPYLHILAEAMKMVFSDKSENMADPAFYRVPVEELISKEYATNLAGRIDPEKATVIYEPPHWVERESGHTTHLSVIDEQRNMVALTQSINSWFGSGILDEKTGILLNNHLADFEDEPGKPNSLEPGKRPVSSIAPTLLLKDGHPFLSIGTPGGSRIISALAQIIINVIDFNMNIDQAIEAPRIHALGQVLYLEKRIAEEIRMELQSKGHHLKIRDDFDNYFGGAQGILIDSSGTVLSGGADSRRDGFVEGY